MSGKKDEEHIDALKQRLYSRAAPPRKRKTFKLSDEPVPVRKSWSQPPQDTRSTQDQVRPAEARQTPTAAREMSENATDTIDQTMGRKRTRHSYRTKVLLAAVFFFVVSVGLSSLFILFGGNSISGENIAISVTGPFTIGGGETIPLQIGVANQNNVPIEAATLIITYPSGTLSADEDGKELFVERMPLDSIGAGETINVPLRARVFGEENQEETIQASIEYRVSGSNATFYKEADPLRFKISSSPIAVSVESTKEISSGQQMEVKLKVRSNSSSKLSDVLVKAEYPNGFDYTSSDPEPLSGQNTWLISELDPDEETVITIRGEVVGETTDERTLNFSVGVPSANDQTTLASVFAVASTGFTIEQPFMDVALSVNNQTGDVISIKPGERSQVSLDIRNTGSNAVYDVTVSAKLSGNALSGATVSATGGGYYDSNTQTVTWDTASRSSLKTIDPNDSETLNFSITPAGGIAATPQVGVDVSVNARRVRDDQASESLVGAAKSTIRVASSPSVAATTAHNSGAFTDVGPIPPVVGRSTSYTLTLRVTNGTNDIAEGVMTATLPTYVEWKGQTSGGGTFDYNDATHELTWNVGSLQGSESILGNFQVSILPSASQIGTTPTLLNSQSFKANDRFTGSSVRTTGPAITTNMSEEFGYAKGNGIVQAQ